MAGMYAYLDDYGKITVWMRRNFYGGPFRLFLYYFRQGLLQRPGRWLAWRIMIRM